MENPTRAERLQRSGLIKKANDLSASAKKLIDSLTDDEFNAILTVRAKISDSAYCASWDQAIHTFGF